jgi:hypothetical protein
MPTGTLPVTLVLVLVLVQVLKHIPYVWHLCHALLSRAVRIHACLLVMTCWTDKGSPVLLSLLALYVFAAGLHYGEVFEQVALLQCRPKIPADMPEDYAGEHAGIFQTLFRIHTHFACLTSTPLVACRAAGTHTH